MRTKFGSLIVVAFALTLCEGVMADCRVKLESNSLTKNQMTEVAQILKEKNFIVAKKLQGNETEFSVNIFKVENCVPGFDEIYETGGGFEISSPAHNIDIRHEGRFSRFFFGHNQFNKLKASLLKIRACH